MPDKPKAKTPRQVSLLDAQEERADDVDRMVSQAFDSDPAVRMKVAQGLSRIDDPRAIFALIELSSDKEEAVKETAQRALGNFKEEKDDIVSIGKLLSERKAQPQAAPSTSSATAQSPVQQHPRANMMPAIERLFAHYEPKKRESARRKLLPSLQKLFGFRPEELDPLQELDKIVRVGHGNPSNSLLLYTTASYIVAAGSPNNHAPANFDLYVDTSPWRLYPSDDYGIIFGAADNVFGSTPGAFNGNGSFYFLYVGTSSGSVQPKGIRLDVCSGGNCNYISGNAGNNGFIGLPYDFVGNASAWDTLHVQRNGPLINVWVNNHLMISVNNTTYTGARKWGMAIIAFDNDPTYPPVGGQMEVDFDNIRMYSLP